MFWKKINRGLLLGGALLIFLVGFIVVKEVQFKRESPAIRTRAQEYIGAFVALQQSVPGVLGEPVDDKTVQAQLGKLDALLEEYWYGNLPKDEISLVDAAALRDEYDAYLNDPLLVRFSKTDLHVLPSSVSVRKDGPNRALVSVTVEIKTEHTGDASAFFCPPYYHSDPAISEDQKRSFEEYSGVLGCNFQLEMQRVNGVWRIVGQEGYCYMSSVEESEV